jgi:hypothetical protein
MTARLIEFLRDLERAVPPLPACHHSITYAQYGSDMAGWEDKLALQVYFEGRFHCFFLDDGDLEKPSGELVLLIAGMLVATPKGNEQLSDTPLRYSPQGKVK